MEPYILVMGTLVFSLEMSGHCQMSKRKAKTGKTDDGKQEGEE